MTAKPAKLSPTALSLLIGAVGLVVLLGGMFLLVMPQQSKASKLDKELTSTQAQIATARLQAKQKPQQAVRAVNLFKLAKAMPDDVDMTGIILQLQKTATQAGVQFNAINPRTLEPALGYDVQPIDLTFEGNFYSLTNFLGRLRRLVGVRHGELDATGRLFTVDAIHFGPGEHGFPAITANLSVNAYVYGTATPAAATTPPTTTAPTESTDSSAAVASGATP